MGEPLSSWRSILAARRRWLELWAVVRLQPIFSARSRSETVWSQLPDREQISMRAMRLRRSVLLATPFQGVHSMRARKAARAA